MIATWSLLLVPVSLVLGYLVRASPPWVFAISALAIVPLAEWVKRGTEQVGRRAGPGIGGLLNVTFGNVAELIIALFVLAEGHQAIVKAQITGSIIGNGLLGLGISILVGSWRRPEQTFDREKAGLLSSLLILALIGLLLPALFDLNERATMHGRELRRLDLHLSLSVSLVLIVVYLANLVYTLYTHRSVFEKEEDSGVADWSLARSLGVLVGATALLSVEAELVSSALEATSAQLGLTPFFLGITVLAVIGNAAEYLTSASYAHNGRIDVAIGISAGASIQVALLIAPLLVLISHFMGHPMDLVFSNPLELIAIAGVALTVSTIALDGKTTWFEGLLLIAVYLLFGLAFFFMK